MHGKLMENNVQEINFTAYNSYIWRKYVHKHLTFLGDTKIMADLGL